VAVRVVIPASAAADDPGEAAAAQARGQAGRERVASGKHAEARAKFDGSYGLARREDDRRREAFARERATALAPVPRHLTISVPRGARREGLTITRNTTRIEPSRWNQRTPVDPGVHEIRAEAQPSWLISCASRLQTRTSRSRSRAGQGTSTINPAESTECFRALMFTAAFPGSWGNGSCFASRPINNFIRIRPSS
jgi:hypothetical protein